MLRSGLLAISMLVLTLLLSGCSTTTVERYPVSGDAMPPAWPTARPSNKIHKILVVIDGTSNDPRDRTNASRMHELIGNQDRDNLSVFYTEGVGSDGRIGGQATGWGMATDVRDAYRFIAESWKPDADTTNEIYIIGFSRGAFGGRILSGLIYTAGIVDLPRRDGEIDVGRSKAFVDRLYDAYKRSGPGDITTTDGRKGLQHYRETLVQRIIKEAGRSTRPNVTIKAVGYWDTVASMGRPRDNQNPFTEGKEPYLDQFCNVEHVFHAVSLDDDRAFDFTPILAMGSRTLELCSDRKPDIQEVWFNGAHADVGGTYIPDVAIEGHLPGVSFNWMLARFAAIGLPLTADPTPGAWNLIPAGAGQYADPYDMIHDARNNSKIWRLRPYRPRDVFGWMKLREYLGGQLKIHYSVVQRMGFLFAIDRRFAKQCIDNRNTDPVMLCSRQLEQMPFLRELIARQSPACVVKDTTSIDPLTKYRLDGYALLGDRVPVDGAPEVRTQCVTIAFDTFAQRDAYMAAYESSVVSPN